MRIKQIIENEPEFSKNIPNFWDNLKYGDNEILKFNPEGKYSKKFSKEYQNFLKLLHNLPEISIFDIGDIVTGKIIKLSEKEIEINIDFKDSVYVPLTSKDLNLIQNFKLGDEIKVMIVSVKEKPYRILGSIKEVLMKDVKEIIKQSYNDNIPIKAKVIESISPGFMLTFNILGIDLNAFMPNTLAGVNRLTEQQNNELIGKDIYVMLETLHKEKNVYVVSRRKYLKSLIKYEIKKLKKETVYTGIVTGTRNYGVFVEFNDCLTGMIYKINLNPDYQNKIEKIEPGTGIDFYVKEILSNNRIILSQNLKPSIWDSIKKGDIFKAKVKSVKEFGILIALDEETNGLILNKKITKSKSGYKDGDEINVKVDFLKPDERKIFLDFS